MKPRQSKPLFAAWTIGALLASALPGMPLAQTPAPAPPIPNAGTPQPAAVDNLPGVHSYKIVPMTLQERRELMRLFLADPGRVKLTEVRPLAAQKIDPTAAQRK